jgi:hypothetical protein
MSSFLAIIAIIANLYNNLFLRLGAVCLKIHALAKPA